MAQMFSIHKKFSVMSKTKKKTKNKKNYASLTKGREAFLNINQVCLSNNIKIIKM